MTLCFFLKIFCDLCYYFIYAGFVADAFGQQSLQFPAMAGCALIAALCRAMWVKYPGKRRRLLPLLLLPGLFLVPAQPAGLAVLAPAALYVLWTVLSGRVHPNYYDAADRFRLELKLMPLPLSCLFFLQEFGPEPRSTPFYLLAFLLASVFYLRTVRHDENTLRQPRFRLLNGLSLALVCLACLMLASPWFRSALFLVLKGAFRVISLPLLLVVFACGALVGLLMEAILPEDFHFEPLKIQGMTDFIDDEQKQEMMDAIAEQDNRTGEIIFTVLGAILAVLFIIWLFRKLAGSKNRHISEPGGIQSRYAAQPMPKREKPLTLLSARTPAQQVRYWYRQLLKKTAQEGGKLQPSMDTRQQTDTASEIFQEHSRPLQRMRQLYLPARYGDRATRQDAKEARELYQSVKK